MTSLPDRTNQYRVIYSGGKQRRKGVAIILNEKIRNSLEWYETASDRMLIIRIQSKPRSIILIQIYGPTEDDEEENKVIFYEDINKAIKSHKRFDDCLVVMGDFNAKLGSDSEGEIVGPYGLGERNENGELLID